MPETFFGVSASELWSFTEQNRDAVRDSQLDSMKAAGIDWVRVELGWREIEPNAPVAGVHTYSWTLADRFVSALARRNMGLMAIPMGTPGWAASAAANAAGCGRAGAVAAARAEDYAAFVEALLRRYGVNGTFWAARPELPRVPIQRVEIGNEPNWSGFWCPEPQPEPYAEMLAAAADRVHAVDPSAEVILGGLAALQDSQHQGESLRGMAADDFLQRAIAHEPGLRESIDAVGFHPYDVDPAMNLAMIGWLRRKLEAVGLPDAEIVLTEFGWRSGILHGALTELLRASNYSQMTSQVARIDCGVSAVAAHTWQTAELDLYNPEHWYGIVSPLTGLLHPSGIAYRDQVALFEGRGPTPAPRDPVEVCGTPDPPDQDGDGVPDDEDDYPLDPTRSSGSGEEPPPPPEAKPEEPRTQVQRVPDSYFGTNVVRLPDDFARLGAEYEAMAAARIGTARQRINWSQIEPAAPSDPVHAGGGEWAWLDRIVLKMAAAGIALRPAFGETPDWVGPGEFDSQFAAFLGRFARRYGVGGEFWAENRNLDEERLAVRDYEIWQYANMDAHSSSGTASASGYASTYLAARSALRAADSHARAIASLSELGVGGRAGQFLRAMVAARPELSGSIDGAALMAEYARTPNELDSIVAELRRALDATGHSVKPIYLIFGAPTGGPEAISEAERAELFADVASRAPRGDCGIAGVFAHAWTTPEADPTNSWHWFGIAGKDDASLTPTAEVYRDVASQFRGYGATPAPATGLHPCARQAPDSDGDGTLDPADPAPLDPAIAGEGSPPPAPSITGGPTSPTDSRSASFSLAATGATGFLCKLDTAPYEECTASPTFSQLTHGEHRLRVRAVDALGLVGPEAERRWEVDIVGPEIRSAQGPGESASGRVRITFEDDGTAATVFCQLDADPWQECASPKDYVMGDGLHEVRIIARDAVGNFGAIKMVAFRVRTVPDVARITSGPASGAVVGARPRFGFDIPGATSSECRFDSTPFAPCSGSGSHEPATPLAPGEHTFEVRGVGELGTRGESATRRFTVDVEPPELEIVPIKLKGTRRAATFGFEVEDASGVAALECKLDRGAWQRCASPHRLRNLARGRHVLSARATDQVGNATSAWARWRTKRRHR